MKQSFDEEIFLTSMVRAFVKNIHLILKSFALPHYAKQDVEVDRQDCYADQCASAYQVDRKQNSDKSCSRGYDFVFEEVTQYKKYYPQGQYKP